MRLPALRTLPSRMFSTLSRAPISRTSCSFPTVGVTRRPLLAEGPWPADERGALSMMRIVGEVAGCWLRTRRGALPLVVHPAWRTDLDTAVAVVMATTGRWRTPEPLRQARRAAREARAGEGSAQDKPA